MPVGLVSSLAPFSRFQAHPPKGPGEMPIPVLPENHQNLVIVDWCLIISQKVSIIGWFLFFVITALFILQLLALPFCSMTIKSAVPA